jgi:DNA polymerase III sliding clamp (beta) subunit (PCNA family)
MMTDYSVEIDYLEFHSALARVAPAMSREETRYYLCGVCLDFRGDHLVLVATDGHRLHKVEIHEAGKPVAKPVDAILPPGFVKQILSIKPSVRSTITVTISKGKVSAAVQGYSLTADLVDGTYPDWRKVIPNEKVSSYLALNVDYMLDLLKAAKAGKAKAIIFRACPPVVGRHVEQPTVMNDATDGEYVLMPMRPDGQTIARIDHAAV